MPDYRDVYAHHADRYDALVAREDHLGHLPRALAEIAPGDALDIVETGAGTGRVTRLLAPRARSLRAFDAAPAMIELARATLGAHPHLRFGVATHEALPVDDASADLALEGWAFGHALSWNPTAWRDDVRRYVAELARVTRPGGTIVLIETMGTGVEAPFAGGHSLEAFHAFVTGELGFAHRVIRTDYAFASVAEATETLGFFFGERMVARVRERGEAVVPECTGLYWRGR
jgi:ubiquinone/menaquinone biosynthesis C-methylase UbiE